MQSTFVLWRAWKRNASLVKLKRGFPKGSVYGVYAIPDFLHHGLAEKEGDHSVADTYDFLVHKSHQIVLFFSEKAVFCSESCSAKDASMHRSVCSE